MRYRVHDYEGVDRHFIMGALGQNVVSNLEFLSGINTIIFLYLLTSWFCKCDRAAQSLGSENCAIYPLLPTNCRVSAICIKLLQVYNLEARVPRHNNET